MRRGPTGLWRHRMRILISCYACYPHGSSEPGCAWRAIRRALGGGHEVWALIEGAEFQDGILKHLAREPMEGFHPVFVRLSGWVDRAFRRGSVCRSVHYDLWQQKIVRVANDLHRRAGFDLAHHVTFGRFWSPSGLRGLGLPFVWGPVGAAESAPVPFSREMPVVARAFEVTRDGVRRLARWDPRLAKTAAAATIGIGITKESCEALRSLGVRRVEQFPQVALTDEELRFFDGIPSPPPGPFRAICMGRLLHWKGFHLAVRAFAAYAKGDRAAELWIVGEGPARDHLGRLATSEGVGSQVRFLGYLPTHREVLDRLAQSHVLIHPALHEAFGNVCLEALASGRPVVCLDIGGPASQVTGECGCVAPASTPAEAVATMAAYLARIARDRPGLREISARARARAHEVFSMRRVGEDLEQIYRDAVAAHEMGVAE